MTTGSEWLSSLSEAPGIERDKKILSAISDGLAVCSWVEITSSYKNHQATFQVCEDAVHVVLDDGSRFRFQVSASLAQMCADVLGASFITPRISDLAYQQATVKISATLLPAGPDMVTTHKSKIWNEAVEQKRNQQEGLMRDCGKAWVLSNRMKPGMAVNHGFYDKSAPYQNRVGMHLWQNEGGAHNNQHTDYSQTLILMNSTCVVDGSTIDVTDVLTSPELSGLLSYDGPLKYTKQV